MNTLSIAKMALIGAAFAAVAGAASAAVLQTATVVTPLQEAPWGSNLALPKFDPSLGTLNGVTVYFKASGYSEFNIDHGTGPGSLTWTLGPIVNLSPPGAVNVKDLTKTQVLAWPGVGDPAHPANPYIVQTPIFSEEQLIVIGGGFFDDYKGTGDFLSSLNVSQFIGQATLGGDINSATAKNFGGATVYALYDYTPASSVPEPGSLALLALAGGALAFTRRRRQA